MIVTRKEPKPVPPPEPTYDLTGLTRDEAWFLHDLLGKLIATDDTGVAHDEMYQALDKKLTGRLGTRFAFRAGDAGLSIGSYLTIKASKVP